VPFHRYPIKEVVAVALSLILVVVAEEALVLVTRSPCNARLVLAQKLTGTMVAEASFLEKHHQWYQQQT
jgi:hypothetical protein